MKNLSFISVLMSVYNTEKYLKEAIESILTQTYENFEFLIIDDGSTDKSRKIIDSFCDKRIRVLTNPKNMGLVYSLNLGLKTANGEYIFRMDADDVALPDRLAMQMAFMKRNGLDLCGGWVETISENPQVWEYPETKEEIKSALLFNSPFAHPAVAFKKKVFIDYNLFYDENYVKAEDYELWSRAVLRCECMNMKRVLLQYRIHDNQTGHKYHAEQFKSSQKIRKMMLKQLGISPTSKELDMHAKLSLNCRDMDKKKMMAWFWKLTYSNAKKMHIDSQYFNLFMYKKFEHILNEKHTREIIILMLETAQKAAVLNIRRYVLLGYGELGQRFYFLLKGLLQCVGIVDNFKTKQQVDDLTITSQEDIFIVSNVIYINTILNEKAANAVLSSLNFSAKQNHNFVTPNKIMKNINE